MAGRSEVQYQPPLPGKSEEWAALGCGGAMGVGTRPRDPKNVLLGLRRLGKTLDSGKKSRITSYFGSKAAKSREFTSCLKSIL